MKFNFLLDRSSEETASPTPILPMATSNHSTSHLPTSSISNEKSSSISMQPSTPAGRFLRRGRTVLRSRKHRSQPPPQSSNNSNTTSVPPSITTTSSAPLPGEPSSRSFVYKRYGSSARSLARTFLLRKEPKTNNNTNSNNNNNITGDASFAARHSLTRPSSIGEAGDSKRDLIIPSHHRPRYPHHSHRSIGNGNGKKGVDGGYTVFVNPWESSNPTHHRHTLINSLSGTNNLIPRNSNNISNNSSSRHFSAGRSFLAKVTRTPAISDNKTGEEIVAALLLLAEKPDFNAAYRAVERDSRACASIWLGHCTWLIRLYSLTILSDPVWAARLGSSGGKRLVPPVCEPKDLPSNIDVVILSSSNPDHLDTNTISRVAPRVMKWLVPLGLENILLECGVHKERIFALDWWQELKVNGTRIVCTPSQHHSHKEGNLWCSWSILTNHGHNLFYCGGTGYRSVDKNMEDVANYEHRKNYGGKACPAFKEISARYGRFDTAILPLGHYKPRSHTASYQGDPVDMLFIHRDLRARKSLGHRWGTYAASGNESLLEPIRELEAALVDAPVSEHDFHTLRHGKMHLS